ncbi:MAG: hypothetical protein COC19_06755, partial [SAR86 cluster bacterium]
TGRLFIGLALVLSVLLGGLLRASERNPEVITQLAGVGPVQTLGNLQYVEVNTSPEQAPAKQLLIFVHGTPGSLTAFETYLRDPLMRQRFHMISVTRPGWVHPDDVKQEMLGEQALALEPLLRKNQSTKGALLMGHSYGGPVVARTAMDFPELVAGMVLVASTGDPQLSGPRWYNRFAMVLPRFILGADLKGANAEILALKPQLINMLPRWQDLQIPVLIVQGSDDKLVHPANADFLQSVLVNASVTRINREDMGHFVLWQEASLIRDNILSLF